MLGKRVYSHREEWEIDKDIKDIDMFTSHLTYTDESEGVYVSVVNFVGSIWCLCMN